MVKPDEDMLRVNITQVGVAAFTHIARRSDQKSRGKNISGERNVFAASLADIQKALDKLSKGTRSADLSKLPSWIPKELCQLFEKEEANKLPPHRPRIDHQIEIEKDADRNTPKIP